MPLSIDAVSVALSSSDAHTDARVYPLQNGSSRRVGTASGAAVATDTVELSVLSQIQLLVRQGIGVGQIANTLGLTESLVNSYLFVPVSANVTLTTPGGSAK